MFLNTTVHGYDRGFSRKYHSWLNYATSNFPDAILIGRMDDDVFVCAPQIFDRLNDVKDELLYYGYPTGSLSECPTHDCVSDMFLIIGAELARRVVNRNFCKDKKEKACLQEGNTAFMFRRWIQIYDDFVFVDEKANGRMIWFYRGTPGATKYRKYKTLNFCHNFLLYHKATVADIYRMNQNNSILLKGSTVTEIPKKGIMKAIHCPTYKVS